MNASSARSTTILAPAAASAVSALNPSAAVHTSSSPRSATTTQPARALFSELTPGMALTVKLWASCGVSARTYGFSLLPASLRQEARAVTRANVAISCTAGDCYATRGNVFGDAVVVRPHYGLYCLIEAATAT